MTVTAPQKIDPKFDLVLERTTDVSPEKVWKAWTTPEIIKQWFAPKPWTVVDCKLELFPGGEFTTTMRSPDGEDMPCSGCVLEVVEGQKFVWSDCLTKGYRPAAQPFFSAIVTIESNGSGGTKYTAYAIHGNEETQKKHKEMGFEQGWGQCFDQLVEVANTL